jgi:hypothetical protein
VRKNIAPGSNDKDRSLIKIDTSNFSAGIINDPPASTIPKSALADGENVITYPTEVIPRTGTTLYTHLEIPPLAGRTGYSATKAGYIVTADQNMFSQADVGHYWVWPGTETEHDEIIRYISGTQVEVANTGTKATTQFGCYVRGHINLWKFHTVQRKWLFMFGNELWVVSLDMATWTSVLILSHDKPNDAISDCREFDEFSWLIFNSGGMFRVDLEPETPVSYRINTPIPNVAIAAQAETNDTHYQYGYLYGAARLVGDALFRDRLTPCRIETESGTNAWDSAYQDYNDVWCTDPIGNAAYYYAKLTCGVLSATYVKVSGWNVITNGTFFVNINGIGSYEIFCDFTNATTMSDVASIIQASLRDWFPDATCDFKDDHFVITSGRVAGGTITWLTAGITGTNIATYLNGTVTGTGTKTYSTTTAAKVVGPLYVPNVPNTDPQEYQWHLTHLPIYRTLDKENLYKQGTSEQRLNDPEQFVWVKDLRMCAAFWAFKYNGHALAQIGQFEPADVGSTIEWENGSIDTILEYVSPDDVVIADPGYYSANTPLMACAIGNGAVIRASQSGTTVTRTHGGTFSSGDVGKTITWSTGYRSYITAFISANQVTVNDDYDKDIQGCTHTAKFRYFCDLTDDDTLRTRQTSLLCKTRFLEAMDNANCGVVVPGYVITAERGSHKIEYCGLPIAYDYLAGFCNKGYQFSETIKDDINYLLMVPNKFIALCSNRTWGGPTNISEFVTMPKTGVVVSILGGIDIIDGNIGCIDWGSIQEVSHGVFRMITNEPGGIGLRDFNGFSFGSNLLEVNGGSQTNWMDKFRDLQKATASLYDGHAGYIVWGNE